jgi:hypothetical protein
MSELSEMSADDDVLLDEDPPRFDASVPFDFSLKVEVPSVRATDPSTALPPSLRSLLDSFDTGDAIDDDAWDELEEMDEQRAPRRRKRRFLWF